MATGRTGVSVGREQGCKHGLKTRRTAPARLGGSTSQAGKGVELVKENLPYQVSLHHAENWKRCRESRQT